MAHKFTLDKTTRSQQDYQRSKQDKIVELTAVDNGVQKVNFNSEGVHDLNRIFSTEIPADNATDQKQSGRCWLFAVLNALCHEFAKQYHTKSFTFSRSYLLFWDRIEKADTFFSHILETVDRLVDDRAVHFYLQAPDTGSGQWHMITSLIRKYGLVSTYVQDESLTANNTAAFSQALNVKLHEDGLVLHKLAQVGKNGEVEQKRQEFLSEVYRVTVVAFGQPMQEFDLKFKDDDGNYKLDQNLSPLGFFHDYFEDGLDDYVTFSNAPDREYSKLYAFPFEDSAGGGSLTRFLNTNIENFREAATKQLKDSETIWFGYDVGKQSDRQKGILAADLYETGTIFNIETKLSKEERLETGASGSTRAMTPVGVDVVGGKPCQWRAENSWGAKVGEKGYSAMDDKWSSEHLFKVVVKEQYLSAKLVKITEGKTTLVPR